MGSNNVTIVGLQWGDEGKGKFVDALCGVCKYVVRFCGGANAGHTVTVAGQRFALHLIPCGILRPGVMNVVGNGVVFDPPTALEEMRALGERSVSVGPANFAVSRCAHVVMPWHKLQDSLSEGALGSGKIGTTARGIGPCYADKANRMTAIRVGDLVNAKELTEKIHFIAELKSRIFAALYNHAPLDGTAIAAEFVEYGRRLAPMIADTGDLLRQANLRGEPILFEGGQGSLLDVDHGTYPFVTSSSVTACGVPSGAGVPPAAVGNVVGVIKAYSTRVGAGPFPTEQDNATGQYIRERGREYGTTTGRPRRCGWFDAVAARYAAELSGVNELALSLLDVLSGLDEIKICTAYRLGGKPAAFDPASLAVAECVYETMPGWKQELGACRKFADLPPQARAYVGRVEELMGRPAGIVSIGPGREQTIAHKTKIQGLA